MIKKMSSRLFTVILFMFAITGLIFIIQAYFIQPKGVPLLKQKNSYPKHNAKSHIHEFSLSNGMRFFLIKDNRLPIVTHSIWYRVGSVDEAAHETGLAHYLEHLMFKGTNRYPDGQYSKIIAQNGGETNAFTSFDYTAYYVRIMRDKLPIIMDLEADRMKNLIFERETAITELSVVMEERKQRTDNNPEAKHSEKEFKALFGNTGYGHPIIGWKEILDTLTPEAALEYYKKNYSPSNAVVIITGDISNEDGEALAHKYYTDIPTSTHDIDASLQQRCRPRDIAQKPLQSRVDSIDNNVKTASLSVLYNTVRINQKFDNLVAMNILVNILGNGYNSRLYKTLVLDKQQAISTDADFLSLRYGGLLYINAIPRETVAFNKLEKLIEKEIYLLQHELVSEKELERAKTQLEAQTIYSRDNQFNYALQLGSLILTCHSLHDMENYVDTIHSITAQKVKEVAQQYILENYRIVGTLQNEQKHH